MRSGNVTGNIGIVLVGALLAVGACPWTAPAVPRPAIDLETGRRGNGCPIPPGN